MGFHGNQIGDMVPILLSKNILLTFQMEQNGTFLDNFLSMTTGFYTKNWFEMKFSLFFIKLLISGTFHVKCCIYMLQNRKNDI